jgi:hypothetical protein
MVLLWFFLLCVPVIFWLDSKTNGGWQRPASLEPLVEVNDGLWCTLVITLHSVRFPPPKLLYLILRETAFQGMLGRTAPKAMALKRRGWFSDIYEALA